MQLHTYREARFLLIRDTLNAIAQRLGVFSRNEINDTLATVLFDGWECTIRATDGIGMKIRHTLEVEIKHIVEKERKWIFTIDVLGANMCKNCYFPGLGNYGKDVDSLDNETWDDLLMLPELFGDAAAPLLETRYAPKTQTRVLRK